MKTGHGKRELPNLIVAAAVTPPADRRRPSGREREARAHHRFAMIRDPNSEHATSFAPSIRRAKS